MELKDVIGKRASVRQFTAEAVGERDLREMVRLAGMAPSANNSQPWRFVAITDRDLLKRMADAVHKKIDHILPQPNDDAARKAKSQVDWFSTFFGDAPAVFAVATHPYEAIVDQALRGSALCHEDMNAMRGYPDVQSVGAAIRTLILAAVDMGYGTCWLSGPLIAREELERELEIAGPWRLAAMVAVGRPAAEPKQRDKKPLEEIFELRA